MSLDGQTVLVTRPAHQACALCAAIEAAGGRALRLPLIDIAEPADVAGAGAGLDWAQTADDLIFTSANAVRWAWHWRRNWQPSGNLFAVGRATARALHTQTEHRVQLPKSDYSAAGVLAMPAMAAVAGHRVAVITGDGGRTVVQHTLHRRGAVVRSVCVYRRVALELAWPQLRDCLDRSDVLVVTSGQALRHLVASTPVHGRGRLWRAKLVVPSARVLEIALELGFTNQPMRPARMSDDAIVTCLQHWAASANGSWG